MSTIDTLTIALTKLQNNWKSIHAQREQALTQVAELDPAVKAAAELLIERFEHPQAATSVLQMVGQAAKLEEIEIEIEALIAVLQVKISTGNTTDVDEQLAANNEALASPLSPAGGSSELSPANQAALDEVSALAAAAGEPSNLQSAGP